HFKKTQLGQVLVHVERSGKNRKYKNQEINHAKTKLNYSLLEDVVDPKSGRVMSVSSHERLNSRLKFLEEIYLENVGKKHRSDLNLVSSWVVTLPKQIEFEDQPEQVEKFFKALYKFMEIEFGVENMVVAEVHMDETSPHAHFGGVSVVKDKKGYEKVSSNQKWSRGRLRRFHGDLDKFLESEMGFKCNVVDEEKAKLSVQREENPNLMTDDENTPKFVNKTIDELKIATKKQMLAEAKAEIDAEKAEIRSQAELEATASANDKIAEILDNLSNKALEVVEELEAEKESRLAAVANVRISDYSKTTFGNDYKVPEQDMFEHIRAVQASREQYDDFRRENANRILKDVKYIAVNAKKDIANAFSENIHLHEELKKAKERERKWLFERSKKEEQLTVLSMFAKKCFDIFNLDQLLAIFDKREINDFYQKSGLDLPPVPKKESQRER
ncbi:MAG: plasmid recombination protein, partial [Culicoidibacterales bacterium]